MDFAAPENRAAAIVVLLYAAAGTFGLVALFPPFTVTALLAAAVILSVGSHVLEVVVTAGGAGGYGGLPLVIDCLLLPVSAVALGHLILLGRLIPGQIVRRVDLGRGHDGYAREASYPGEDAQRPFMTRKGPLTHEILLARFFTALAAFFFLLLAWRAAATAELQGGRLAGLGPHHLAWAGGAALSIVTRANTRLRQSDAWTFTLGLLGVLAGAVLLRAGLVDIGALSP